MKQVIDATDAPSLWTTPTFAGAAGVCGRGILVGRGFSRDITFRHTCGFSRWLSMTISSIRVTLRRGTMRGK